MFENQNIIKTDLVKVAMASIGERPKMISVSRDYSGIANLCGDPVDFFSIDKHENLLIAFKPVGDYLIKAGDSIFMKTFLNRMKTVVFFEEDPHSGELVNLSLRKWNDICDLFNENAPFVILR